MFIFIIIIIIIITIISSIIIIVVSVSCPKGLEVFGIGGLGMIYYNIT